MADTTIDSSTADLLGSTITPRALVWISSSVGYVFYTIDTTYTLVYRKTTDSGASWGAEVTISGNLVTTFSIWYDKWTKDITTDEIHIAWISEDSDDILYNSFSVADDTLDGEVVVYAGTSADATSYDWTEHCLSVIRSRGGNIYVGGWIDDDGENGFYRSTDGGGTFSSRTSMADGNAVDRIMFCTGNEADSNDIYCIYQDVSANEITLKVYDDSANSWSESAAIQNSTSENAGFWNFDAVDRHSDGHVLLANWNRHSVIEAPDPAIEFFDITDIDTWSQLTNVYAADSVYGICGMMINQQNDKIYVAYINGTTGGAIKYKSSTDGGSTWSVEAAMSETSDDHRVIMGGTSIGLSGGRWMPCWYNDDLFDILCNTGNSVSIAAASSGTNFSINIGDAWKTVSALKINIGDSWKTVSAAKINVGDTWKTIF